MSKVATSKATIYENMELDRVHPIKYAVFLYKFCCYVSNISSQ